MVSFESKGLKKLVTDVVQGLLVEELLNDPEITQERIDVCCSCDYMDTENVMCSKCGCFLVVKTKSKVNKKLGGGSEITHCPVNKWLDEFSKIGYDTAKKQSQQS